MESVIAQSSIFTYQTICTNLYSCTNRLAPSRRVSTGETSQTLRGSRLYKPSLEMRLSKRAMLSNGQHDLASSRCKTCWDSLFCSPLSFDAVCKTLYTAQTVANLVTTTCVLGTLYECRNVRSQSREIQRCRAVAQPVSPDFGICSWSATAMAL